MEGTTRSSNRPFGCYCIGNIHRALPQSRGKIGRTISVFEKTINIRTAQDELLVVTLDGTRSPVNLNVGADPAQQPGFSGLVRAGQDVFVKAGCKGTEPRAVLHAGDVVVYIGEPDVFQNSLEEPTAESLCSFAAEIDRVLGKLVAGAEKKAGCLLNPDMTTEGLFAAFVDRLRTGSHYDNGGTMEALLGLCGRGPGFTPAGDDFIAGYLAVSNWLNRVLELAPPLIPGEKFARLTTWISFKLMEYSAKGLLDRQVQRAVNSVAGGDIAGYISCIELVGKRGHTSGIDFATGATIGVCATVDRAFGARMLERVSALERKPVQLS
jgi:hypothetical protein